MWMSRRTVSVFLVVAFLILASPFLTAALTYATSSACVIKFPKTQSRQPITRQPRQAMGAGADAAASCSDVPS